MMELSVLVNGAFRENCYILSSNGKAVIIDPGVDCKAIVDFLRLHKLSAEVILITHAHFDHCQCAGELAAELNVNIYISKTDYKLAQITDKIPHFDALFFDGFLCENSALAKLNIIGHEFKIIYTPGHTEGSVCIEVEGMLFTGDTLFLNAVGRTDLPTGSFDKLKQSLKLLCDMYDDIEVFSGHGPSTFLSKERPFVGNF